MRNATALLAVVWLAAPLPAQDMPLSQVLIDGETWRPVGAKYAEVGSLACDAAGQIHVASAKQIDRLDAQGKATLFAKTDAPVSGMAFAKDGRLIACVPETRQVVAIDAEGKASVVVDGLAAHDVAVLPDGALYLSVPGERAVYLVRGSKQQRVDEGIAQPAGLTLWPDAGTLVVGDGGGKQLFALRVDKEGALSARAGYYTLRPAPGKKLAGTGPLAVDSTGRLYAASDLGVQIFDTTGRMSGVLLQPVRAAATALCFGGPKHDHLYAAFGGQIFARATRVKGAR
ncbi:MAG: SMP-30/gluconolactonase/LRE family protein [Gemmataceae bacterium]